MPDSDSTPRPIDTLLGRPLRDTSRPKPNDAPDAASILILPLADLEQAPWNFKKPDGRTLRDKWALHKGGSVTIVRNAEGELAAFVPDPAKLNDATRAEIAQILGDKRYQAMPPGTPAP